MSDPGDEDRATFRPGDGDDSYAAIVDELSMLYHALPGLELKPSHHRVTHLVHGWYMRVHRSCAAVLLLQRTGLAVESAPLRRAIQEHVVALKWVAVEGSGDHRTSQRRSCF